MWARQIRARYIRARFFSYTNDEELLNYEPDQSAESDAPNNCYTIEAFCQHYKELKDIMESAIHIQGPAP